MFWFYRGCFGVRVIGLIGDIGDVLGSRLIGDIGDVWGQGYRAQRRHRGCFGFIGDVLGLNGAAPIPTGPTQPHSFVPPLFGAEWALKG